MAKQSGLSLRTIQRVEAGHRISYASLRALAD
ncbi:MAG: transcriptional regulator, partial [Pseudomonadota bacterium]